MFEICEGNACHADKHIVSPMKKETVFCTAKTLKSVHTTNADFVLAERVEVTQRVTNFNNPISRKPTMTCIGNDCQ